MECEDEFAAAKVEVFEAGIFPFRPHALLGKHNELSETLFIVDINHQNLFKVVQTSNSKHDENSTLGVTSLVFSQPCEFKNTRAEGIENLFLLGAVEFNDRFFANSYFLCATHAAYIQ